MKRLLILNLLICSMMAIPAAADDVETYGEGVTLEQAVAIDTLLTKPHDFVGTKVRVDGVITGVCQKRGCWMQVTNPETGSGVRIKVEDGVIVFPYTSMGREASAEGVFEAIKLTPEQVAARAAAEQGHAAGESCDKEAPKRDGSGPGCDAPVVDQYVYMIRGTGAVIKG